MDVVYCVRWLGQQANIDSTRIGLLGDIAGALGLPTKVMGRLRCAGLYSVYQDSEVITDLYGIKALSVKKVLDSLTPAKRKSRRFKNLKIVLLSSWKVKCGIAEYTRALTDYLECDTEVVDTPGDVPDGSVLHIQYEPGLFTDKTGLDKLIENWQNPKFITAHYYDDWLQKNRSKFDKVIVHDARYRNILNHEYLVQGCPVFPEMDRDKLRGELGIGLDKTVLASFGFYMPWKNLDKVFEALASYVSLNRNLHLLWLHSVHPQASQYGQKLGMKVRELVRLHRIDENVTISQGFMQKESINMHLQSADLGFLWSSQDVPTGSSAVSKEFVSARCPLIVTDMSHYADLERGVKRVDFGTPIHPFLYKVLALADDKIELIQLRKEQKDNYNELNYKQIALKHQRWYDSVGGKS